MENIENIEKDIEKLQSFKTRIDIDPYFHSTESFEYLKQPIENVLSDRETWKKIAEILASYIGKIDVSEDLCNDELCSEGENCNACILDWARKEVENDKQS